MRITPLNQQPISGVDIQDAVIPLLQASPLVMAAYLPSDSAKTPLFSGTILDDDPGEPDDVTPGVSYPAEIALHLIAEGDRTVVGGPAGSGKRAYVTYFALIIYVGQNGKRDPLAKRRLAVLTRNCREALMQDAVRMDGADAQRGQRWWGNAFKEDGPCTIYQKQDGFRRSTTFINFFSRPRTLSAPSIQAEP